MTSKKIGGLVGIGLCALIGCGGSGSDETQGGNGAWFFDVRRRPGAAESRAVSFRSIAKAQSV
jgi:hypothetical protein